MLAIISKPVSEMRNSKPILFFIVLFLITGFLAQCQNPVNEKLKALNKEINSEKYPNIDAMLVAKNAEVIIEEYFNGFGEDSLHDMRSSFKSITSILAGIAIDQGLFNLKDSIEIFIKEWEGDPRGKIRIKDLLEMKSGLACEGFFDKGPDCESEMANTDDWLAYILSIPLRYEPGTQWEYSSMEPELIGEIISRTSQMSLMDFAEKYLFKYLKIENYQWFITPRGGGYAAGSFFMKPKDMLKIAELVRQKGKWKGEQIVSSQWINSATDCKTLVDMSFLYYAGTEGAISSSALFGFYWYSEILEYKNIKTNIIFASGNGGQYMMYLEDYNTTLVFTGSNYGSSRSKLPFDIILKHIIPILEETH